MRVLSHRGAGLNDELKLVERYAEIGLSHTAS